MTSHDTTEVLQRSGTFLVRVGTAAGLIAAVNWIFDYPFTGWAIWHFGPLIGGGILIAVAPVANYGIIRWYRGSSIDWFGMEWLRAQEAVNSNKWSGRFIRTCLKRSRLLAFAAIAAFIDPTYAFIYQRGRITGTRFTNNDWWWFATANIIGVLPWIIGASIAVEAVRLTFS